MDEKDKDGKDSGKNEGNEVSNNTECTVCLQPFVQPVQLPCKHIFCYLCVKGIIQQNSRCALCRKAIPQNYMNNPQLLATQEPAAASNDSYKWFYEGKNGWWQYDDRTSTEIETAYQNSEQECEVLIAGFVYTIDFQRNLQFRKFTPGCRRRIKRDLLTVSKKGVAGIHQNHDSETTNSKPSCSNNSSCNTTVPENLSTKKIVIILPHNGSSGIHFALSNGALSTTSNSEAPCSKIDNSCNQTSSRTLADSITVPGGSAAGVDPSADTEVLPSSSNCKASCSNDNSSNPTSLGKLTTEDDITSPPSNKRKRSESSDILEITEHSLKKGEDMYNAFGITVASKLCEMNNVQRLYAEKIINATLFQGLMGKLSENSHII